MISGDREWISSGHRVREGTLVRGAVLVRVPLVHGMRGQLLSLR